MKHVSLLILSLALVLPQFSQAEIPFILVQHPVKGAIKDSGRLAAIGSDLTVTEVWMTAMLGQNGEQNYECHFFLEVEDEDPQLAAGDQGLYHIYFSSTKPGTNTVLPKLEREEYLRLQKSFSQPEPRCHAFTDAGKVAANYIGGETIQIKCDFNKPAGGNRDPRGWGCFAVNGRL